MLNAHSKSNVEDKDQIPTGTLLLTYLESLQSHGNNVKKHSNAFPV